MIRELWGFNPHLRPKSQVTPLSTVNSTDPFGFNPHLRPKSQVTQSQLTSDCIQTGFNPHLRPKSQVTSLHVRINHRAWKFQSAPATEIAGDASVAVAVATARMFQSAPATEIAGDLIPKFLPRPSIRFNPHLRPKSQVTLVLPEKLVLLRGFNPHLRPKSQVTRFPQNVPNPPSSFNPHLRPKSQVTPRSLKTSPRVWKFQSAPATEIAGDQPHAPAHDTDDKFQSAPATEIAGDAESSAISSFITWFQSAPATEIAGDALYGCKPFELPLFQSAPATEIAGDVSPPESGGFHVCFNPHLRPKSQVTHTTTDYDDLLKVSIRTCDRNRR